MEPQKAYFAIIPANVRYDSKLTANAKLLYGEITALSNEKGFCWANNQYFADLYGVSKKTISQWITSLEDRGYVRREVVYKPNSKEIESRKIHIVFGGGVSSLATDNHQEETATKGKISQANIEDFFNSVWKLYPKKEGKGNISKTQRYKLYQLGYDVISKCIERYKDKLCREGTEDKYIKLGSTFFNSGYVDFLDENYLSEKEPKAIAQDNSGIDWGMKV